MGFMTTADYRMHMHWFSWLAMRNTQRSHQSVWPVRLDTKQQQQQQPRQPLPIAISMASWTPTLKTQQKVFPLVCQTKDKIIFFLFFVHKKSKREIATSLRMQDQHALCRLVVPPRVITINCGRAQYCFYFYFSQTLFFSLNVLTAQRAMGDMHFMVPPRLRPSIYIIELSKQYCYFYYEFCETVCRIEFSLVAAANRAQTIMPAKPIIISARYTNGWKNENEKEKKKKTEKCLTEDRIHIPCTM